jgi:mono/diheme cytochrome c family protein
MLTGCPSPPQNTLEQEPLYQSGQALFSNRCAACHGMQGEGASMLLEGKNIHFNDPAWQKRLNDTELTEIITSGRGNMPAFNFTPEEEKALVFFIRHLPETSPKE